MEFLTLYGLALLVIFISVTALWLLSLWLRDASIVDIFWGSGFVIAAWVCFAFAEGYAVREWLIVALVSIWGLRLTLYLARRNMGKGEDFRYKVWRKEFGASWWWLSYIRVFLLQGFVMWVVFSPILGALYSPEPASLTMLDAMGILLWFVGFTFEAVGDWQLMRFRADSQNKGKVLDTGLWRYTRHPNYFGDALQWWGFYLIALSAGAWFTIISPIVMTFFLMRVSGVAMLERSLKKNKPQYADYIARTSAFFPLPPKPAE